MQSSRLILLLGATLFFTLVAGAQPPSTGGGPKGQLQDTAVRQSQLSRAFETFRTRLSVLASRMETGGNAEDRKRARSLRQALALISEQNTSGRFETLIRSLTTQGADQNLDVLGRVVKDNKELRQDLQKILALLLSDDARSRAEKTAALQKLLEQLKDLRGRQARLQASTETGKQDDKTLARAQDRLTEMTRDVLRPKDNENSSEKEQREKVRKPVQSAVQAQGKAGKSLQGGQRGQAGDAQDQAIGDLDEAIQLIENDLSQGREEERQQALQELLARCKRMLQMQVEVRDGTARLDEELRKSKEGKLDLAQVARANRLSDQQRHIEREGLDALKLLQNEGSAVAFVEVFEQLNKDLGAIVDRLDRSDVSTVTQAIENDAIDTLKEMIKALEKSIGDNPNPAPPPPGGPGGLQPGRKLVDLIQQLKMIHGMQKRINDRTTLYGKHYKGEQVPAAEEEEETATTAEEKKQYERTRQELKSLSGRQQRLSKVTREVSKLPEAQRPD